MINSEVAFRFMYLQCFYGLTGLALRLLPDVPTLEIFSWWHKKQHTPTIRLTGALLCRAF
jgi:hypothetical protein